MYLLLDKIVNDKFQAANKTSRGFANTYNFILEAVVILCPTGMIF